MDKSVLDDKITCKGKYIFFWINNSYENGYIFSLKNYDNLPSTLV